MPVPSLSAWLTLFVPASLIGLLLGLLGGGGSILTVPLLVYWLGWDPKTAIPGSLFVVGCAGLAGLWAHARADNVRWRLAVGFGVLTMVASFAFAKAARFLTAHQQMGLFALVLMIAATFMFRRGSQSGPVTKTPYLAANRMVLGLKALGVGAVTGLVGVGGGFLVVPALALTAGVTMQAAVGTSLAIISANAFAGLAGYLGQVGLPWGDLLVFTVGTTLGTAVGGTLAKRVPGAVLKKGFAVFLWAVSLFVGYQWLREASLVPS